MNLKKNEIQQKGLALWKVNKKGRLEMCTGSGKSRIAVLAAMETEGNICLIVPTENLRDETWKKEFEQWGSLEVYNRITRICYASASKVSQQTFELVILDEVHRLTPLAYTFFENNQVTHTLGLTATMSDDEERQKLIDSIAPLNFKYTLAEGVEDKVVSPFRLHIIETNLNNRDKNIVAGTKLKPFNTTEAAQYSYLDRLQRVNMYEGNHGAAKSWAQKRMHFIYNLQSKTNLAIRVKETLLEDKRALIFCGSIKQAETIHEFSYHSASKENNLQKLINKEIDILSCVNKVNEGENIPDLDCALIVQLNSKELDLIQRIGRIVRWREGHFADIYIIKTLNTRDETWVNKAIASFDPEITPIIYHHAENLFRPVSQDAQIDISRYIH